MAYADGGGGLLKVGFGRQLVALVVTLTARATRIRRGL
jgi:hypothetical protein